MGAYNWVDVSATCPLCGKAAIVRAQTMFASSYDGDETGRFFDRNYSLGAAMAWWPPKDSRDE
jgi:hypothetical protein